MQLWGLIVDTGVGFLASPEFPMLLQLQKIHWFTKLELNGIVVVLACPQCHIQGE